MKQNENSKNFDDWLLKTENELKSAIAIFEYFEDPPTDIEKLP